MTTTANKQELKNRFEAKRKRLEARLAELKADSAQKRSESAEETQKKLDELNNAVKDGWDNLSDAAAERINKMLRD
jgi:DNA anti-recombination protein RmuC